MVKEKNIMSKKENEEKKDVGSEIAKTLEIGEDLDKEMVDMPGNYFTWGELIAEVSKYIKELNTEFEIWLAKMKAKVEEEEIKNGGKKVGQEAKLDLVLIKYEKEYMGKRKEIIDAEEKYDKLKEGLRASSIKADMLVQLGANIRKEMDMTGMNSKKKKSEFEDHTKGD